jgi:molybdate-binding protein/DNA-binding XRE family transcriptional regulator
MTSEVRNSIRARRQRLGIQQRDVAAQVNVSRQTLSSIEAGDTVPSTLIALNLARVLQCRVEDLFSVEGSDDKTIKALLPKEQAGQNTEEGAPGEIRVALAQVGRDWMARRLDGDFAFAQETPADGLASPPKGRSGEISVRPLRSIDDLQRNLFVAGCDPALGLLSRHLGERPQGPRLHWIEAASMPALDELSQGRVHIAGVHLDDAKLGNRNASVVRRRFGADPMLMVTLASWEQGLVFKKDGKRTFKSVADLAGRSVRVIGREEGAGAQELLRSLLKQTGMTTDDLDIVKTARGHRAVAQCVASNLGDVGVATWAAAKTFGLGFAPLAQARFDLVFHAELGTDERARALLECLASARFRRDLGAMTGYLTAQTGATVEAEA